MFVCLKEEAKAVKPEWSPWMAFLSKCRHQDLSLSLAPVCALVVQNNVMVSPMSKGVGNDARPVLLGPVCVKRLHDILWTWEASQIFRDSSNNGVLQYKRKEVCRHPWTLSRSSSVEIGWGGAECQSPLWAFLQIMDLENGVRGCVWIGRDSLTLEG